ncbi:MAG: hypothetical protein VW349_00580, partial [Gammaproteobacteria bacterium]
INHVDQLDVQSPPAKDTDVGYLRDKSGKQLYRFFVSATTTEQIASQLLRPVRRANLPSQQFWLSVTIHHALHVTPAPINHNLPDRDQ